MLEIGKLSPAPPPQKKQNKKTTSSSPLPDMIALSLSLAVCMSVQNPTPSK